jgi:glutaminyl-peptide cyclotransferase
MIFFSQWKKIAAVAPILVAISVPKMCASQAHFDGVKAYEYARQIVAIGPRWPTGPGHPKAEAFLRDHFQRAHDQLEEDTFMANTPIGPVPMSNFIVRYPGKKNGVIVLASHYETNYPLRNINFVGANDGAATTGLLMAIGDRLHTVTLGGKKLDGYSVWLVFFDGEEAINTGSRSD